ncbi:M15 family metallopeptidase [Peribacillus glennii]|uniref:D-alanyl-D-alanine carboxypeptidase family protein n=1 Tax=Peribacillus glennii TaxID=2303991 RepID=A0A372LD03_9BACI|nr:M15 family metallopeptidase [Peribacillus glennii]RFU63872.1 D-alanyl-D-alanine carboxypeptidase family protein [Peribacillus glennii]
MKKRIINISAIIFAGLFFVYLSAQINSWNQEPAEKTSPHQAIIGNNKAGSSSGQEKEARVTVAVPHDIPVLVNKDFILPANYQPTDLIYPDVPFLFEEKIEKRMLRREAAHALEMLFQAARNDGLYLAGVSAYRSHATQKKIYQNNIERDGVKLAATYSASPGTSEHQTGLAIDVSGSSGTCATVDCFGGTKEAEWLANHAHEHGFIIRYPKGKQHVTGYKYEPWHLRYVGTEIAQELFSNGITLEEFSDAVPVSK